MSRARKCGARLFALSDASCWQCADFDGAYGIGMKKLLRAQIFASSASRLELHHWWLGFWKCLRSLPVMWLVKPRLKPNFYKFVKSNNRVHAEEISEFVKAIRIRLYSRQSTAREIAFRFALIGCIQTTNGKTAFPRLTPPPVWSRATLNRREIAKPPEIIGIISF